VRGGKIGQLISSRCTVSFEAAEKRESLAAAFRKLSARNLSLIPVVEEQRLIGIVTLQNLMHSMALLAESRKLRRQSLKFLKNQPQIFPDSR